MLLLKFVFRLEEDASYCSVFVVVAVVVVVVVVVELEVCLQVGEKLMLLL